MIYQRLTCIIKWSSYGDGINILFIWMILPSIIFYLLMISLNILNGKSWIIDEFIKNSYLRKNHKPLKNTSLRVVTLLPQWMINLNSKISGSSFGIHLVHMYGACNILILLYSLRYGNQFKNLPKLFFQLKPYLWHRKTKYRVDTRRGIELKQLP